ncbi:MAG TPA: TonB-dependent receptor [Verrucomicrobiae bacterium]|jgi:iron complex outermembrane receptor protein|nr:TonB-dependent receptor [Verrucomicrobiae bacterium]
MKQPSACLKGREWTARPFFQTTSGLIAIVLGLMACASTQLHAQGTAPASTNAPAAESYKRMTLEQLMNLDVTSVAKEPEPYGEAPAAIQVITGDDIRRSGATLIPDALRLADNLEVAQVTSSSWDISARGFNSAVGNKLLVLMDGRSVYTPLFSGVIWNMQDYLLEDIDRIEVISGPGGTLWGANAVNGVINITSKSAQDTQGLYLESGGGTGTQDFAAVRYGGTLASNVYYRVYGKYFDQSAEVLSDGASANDSWNRGQGGFRIDSDAAPQNHLTLQGDFFEGDTDVASGDEGTTGGGNILGRWTHTFVNDNELTLQIYYDQTHLAAPFPTAPALPAFPPYFPPSPAIPGGVLTENLDTCDLDFQDRFGWGTFQHFVWGLGYRFTHDAVHNTDSVAFLPATLDQNLYSGFVQDEIKLQEKLILTLGTKVEHNDFTGFEEEPSGRLQWNFAEHQTVWGAISKAVRTPSRYDEDLFQPAPGYTYLFRLVGSPDFQSETVIAYELGYRAQLGEKVSGSLSAFYNDYNHVRSTSDTIALDQPSLITTYFENNLQAQTYGFELSGNYQAQSWWRLHAGYDLLKENVWVRAGTTDVDDGLNETADPQQQVMLRSSMDLPYRIELDVAGRWIDTVHNNSGSTPGTVPSYGEMDARIGWHATSRLELSVVGQNLLHDQHPEAGFPGPAREQIARAVFGKVSYLW